MFQTFLTAEWRKLIMANYVVDKSILQSYLPAHTTLDCYNDKCYVSLVGFMFQDTRLRGFHFPMHVNFQEVNLRFYVTYQVPGEVPRRGVVFIKELVPRSALTFVANNFYGENYETVPMRHKWHLSKAGQVINYRWNYDGWQKLQVVASEKAEDIEPGSAAEFITEHYWGYTKLRNGTTSQYQVVHPKWSIYQVYRYNIEVDFAVVYGSNFAFLNDVEPDSVFLAEGSEVSVRKSSRIQIDV